MAEDERAHIVKRASEGRKAAMDRGVRFARKPKLTDYQRQRAIEMRAEERTVARTQKCYLCNKRFPEEQGIRRKVMTGYIKPNLRTIIDRASRNAVRFFEKREYCRWAILCSNCVAAADAEQKKRSEVTREISGAIIAVIILVIIIGVFGFHRT